MLIDPETIPYSDILPNSIIIVRGPDEQLDKLIPRMQSSVDSSVAFQRMGEGTEVLCISEENLNKAGWFKVKTGEAPPSPQP